MKSSPLRPGAPAMEARVSRRAATRAIATASLTLAAVVAIGKVFTIRAAQPTASVVEAANVRSGPGTNFPVVAQVPKREEVTLEGRRQNDFLAVTYDGRSGWVYAPLVAATLPPDDETMAGEAYAATAASLFCGPGADHTALRTVQADDPLNVSNTIQHGFRYVVHEGTAGWIPEEQVAWRPARSAGAFLTTTTGLNLRAEPSTSSRILLVMPTGSTVTPLEGTSGGFRKVYFKGTTGWAAMDYLA